MDLASLISFAFSHESISGLSLNMFSDNANLSKVPPVSEVIKPPPRINLDGFNAI